MIKCNWLIENKIKKTYYGLKIIKVIYLQQNDV